MSPIVGADADGTLDLFATSETDAKSRCGWLCQVHLPFRRREDAMLRFRRVRVRQNFASLDASIHALFNLERSLGSWPTYCAITPPLLPRNTVSARHQGLPNQPNRDRFEVVRQHPIYA